VEQMDVTTIGAHFRIERTPSQAARKDETGRCYATRRRLHRLAAEGLVGISRCARISCHALEEGSQVTVVTVTQAREVDRIPAMATLITVRIQGPLLGWRMGEEPATHREQCLAGIWRVRHSRCADQRWLRHWGALVASISDGRA
jgi:hypothetical protein